MGFQVVVALGNLLCIALLLWLVFRKSGASAEAEKAQQAIQAEQTQRHQATLEALTATQATLQAALQQANERLERELRREITESARGGRQELTQSLATFQQTLVAQSSEATRTQNTQIDAFEIGRASCRERVLVAV